MWSRHIQWRIRAFLRPPPTFVKFAPTACLGELYCPLDVAEWNGEVFVCQAESVGVYSCNAPFPLLRQWAMYTDSPGDANITLDPLRRRVFVLDGTMCRVYTWEGVFVTLIVLSDQPQLLLDPEFLFYDKVKQEWIARDFGYNIKVYDGTGTLLRMWSRFQYASKQDWQRCVRRMKRINDDYVAAVRSRHITIHQMSDGTKVQSWKVLPRMFDLAVDESGGTAYAICDGPRIDVLRVCDGEKVDQWNLPEDWHATRACVTSSGKIIACCGKYLWLQV